MRKILKFSISGWIFQILFPKQRAVIMRAAKHCAEQELGREYRRKFTTLQRSPLDESEWVRKFVALDADYEKLEKEAAELRIENIYLNVRIKKLSQ